MNAMTDAKRIKAKGLEFGFSAIGIARAEPLEPERQQLREWLDRGYHASMDWMRRAEEKRGDPSKVLSGVRSVISVALNYYADPPHKADPGTGKISRYAWGDDYHDILGDRLRLFASWFEREYPATSVKSYVDTGPVMDKAWAARAGIGWEGKHTNVITREYGSWVFLGELLTTLDLECDEPAIDRCGTCSLCIEACPTHAIVEPYVVDANLCLSYLTIEHRGEIHGEVTGQFDHWIYGCDTCQDVCPWNEKFSVITDVEGFRPREGNLAPPLEAWAGMSQEEFSARFKGSPVKRTKRDGLTRNVRIVLGKE